MSDGTRFFELTVDEGRRDFFPGSSTKTLGYNGDYLGPTIRVRQGENVAIQVNNRLDETTSVHWHGADVPAESDGGPHQGISPGKSWTASFQVRQPAATLWYHPHMVGTTGRQVYQGLAGLLIIDDDESDTLDLPVEYGVDDIPVVLQDRRFDAAGEFTYRPSMPDVMHGYFGNTILVNGVPNPIKAVPRGPVRLRLLNGSNSTLLKLTLDGLPEMVQIASDGGFLASPVGLGHIILSPGERAEVIVDFSQAGQSPVVLKAETNQGRLYDVLEFLPVGNTATAWKAPDILIPPEDIPESEADRTRRFVLQSGMGGRMTINGKTMKLNRVNERVPLGSTEIWEIENRDGMMSQPHSFHVHAVQFHILDINGRPPPEHESGPKDTVLLWPGDKIRIIARFDSFPGLFMYHCHLLEHEDNGMMGQFLIESP